MKKSGFTLIEITVVLIIAGFLIAGVLMGGELVKQARCMSVIKDMQNYTNSYYQFKKKYDGMPGDLSDAVQYGLCRDSAGVQNCAATQIGVTGAVSGNGNGNDFLLSTKNPANAPIVYDGEIANYWVHLSNSGFVKAHFSQVNDCRFTATNSASNCRGVAGENFPEEPIGNGLLLVSVASIPDTPWMDVTATTWQMERIGGLYYTLGMNGDLGSTHNFGTSAFFGSTAMSDVALAGQTLTPEDASYFDHKLDDGVPVTGDVKTFGDYGAAGPFSTNGSSDPSTMSYIVTFTDLFFSQVSAESCTSPNAVTGVMEYNLELQQPRCSIRIRMEAAK